MVKKEKRKKKDMKNPTVWPSQSPCYLELGQGHWNWCKTVQSSTLLVYNDIVPEENLRNAEVLATESNSGQTFIITLETHMCHFFMRRKLFTLYTTVISQLHGKQITHCKTYTHKLKSISPFLPHPHNRDNIATSFKIYLSIRSYC